MWHQPQLQAEKLWQQLKHDCKTIASHAADKISAINATLHPQRFALLLMCQFVTLFCSIKVSDNVTSATIITFPHYTTWNIKVADGFRTSKQKCNYASYTYYWLIYVVHGSSENLTYFVKLWE